MARTTTKPVEAEPPASPEPGQETQAPTLQKAPTIESLQTRIAELAQELDKATKQAATLAAENAALKAAQAAKAQKADAATPVLGNYVVTVPRLYHAGKTYMFGDPIALTAAEAVALPVKPA